MASKRRTILTKIKDALDGLDVTDLPLKISAINTFFDPIQREHDFPLFSVVSEPETIIVSLGGTRKDRTMRVAIMGFAFSKSPDDIFLDGEDIADEIVQALTLQANVDTFRDAFTGGCGFSITEIGPVVVEQFEMKLTYNYMSVPCSVAYIDP